MARGGRPAERPAGLLQEEFGNYVQDTRQLCFQKSPWLGGGTKERGSGGDAGEWGQCPDLGEGQGPGKGAAVGVRDWRPWCRQGRGRGAGPRPKGQGWCGAQWIRAAGGPQRVRHGAERPPPPPLGPCSHVIPT